MPSKIITHISSILLVLIFTNVLQGANLYEGLDIHADQATTNLITSVSRLSGHVELKHFGKVITGDNAEVQSNLEQQSQRFIISGSPVKFVQNIKQSTMNAEAGQLIYEPSKERITFEEKVSIFHKTAETQFQVSASEVQVQFYLEQPSKLDISGKPLLFSHELSTRKIQIEADKISWDASSETVVLYLAKVLDEQVVFSADEIIYNFNTGEISAVGEGESRPSYRFDPSAKKQQSP